MFLQEWNFKIFYLIYHKINQLEGKKIIQALDLFKLLAQG